MSCSELNLSSFVLEITPRCNRNCIFCYNVWKCPNTDYPQGPQLSTQQVKEIILKLKSQTDISYLAISGGEPLLRKDVPEIIRFCSDNLIAANLLTNGSLLTDENCRKCVDANTSIFEVPLLTVDSDIHYRLTGRNDLKKVIQGIKNLKCYNATLVTAFVATNLNITHIKETAETAIALGADGIMFNRFNAGGEGVKHIDQLMPSRDAIQKALAILDDLAAYYGIQASASTPIPKCLINPADFKHITFGYCPSGNEESYFTIDPYGNVRLCNHTPTTLGNLLEHDLKTILAGDYVATFRRSLPSHCFNCKNANSCWGGCKASAQVCGTGLNDLDPFLKRNLYHQCSTSV
jgi:radical SAM protein with 4Fe4S-binding SPASM domain